MKIKARISINKVRLQKNFNTEDESKEWLNRLRAENSDKSLDGEIWKPIPNYQRYEASNFGRVRSLNYKKTGMVKILKPALAEGYLFTVFLNDQGKYKSIAIHRVVAMAFYGLKKGLVINHKDGIKTNNNVENLEWCTQSYNALHSFEMGLQIPKIGMLNGMAKLTNEQVIKARKQKQEGGRFWGRNELAKELGISPKHLQKIVNPKDSLWKNV